MLTVIPDTFFMVTSPEDQERMSHTMKQRAQKHQQSFRATRTLHLWRIQVDITPLLNLHVEYLPPPLQPPLLALLPRRRRRLASLFLSIFLSEMEHTVPL